jgi:hypothetical protein
MRTLLPPPDAVIDAVSGAPRAGSYRGHLPPTDLSAMGKSRLDRLGHEKRWVYFAVVSDDLLLAGAVVHLSYLTNCFVFAYERGRSGMTVDRSILAPPFACQIGDASGEGCSARVGFLGSSVRFAREVGSDAYDLRVRVRGLSIDARLSTAGAPPAIGVVASLPGGLCNATEKGTLLAVTGEATLGGEKRSLDGALGGYDYTHGYLARHTTWRWAFALGRAKSGERVGLNLVEGFVGEPECAVWIDGELFPLAEGRFDFDRKRPEDPWFVRTADGSVDLRFEPAGLHREEKNFGVVASHFVQPAGAFSGTVRAGGRELTLDRVLGVTEDQDVLW